MPWAAPGCYMGCDDKAIIGIRAVADIRVIGPLEYRWIAGIAHPSETVRSIGKAGLIFRAERGQAVNLNRHVIGHLTIPGLFTGIVRHLARGTAARAEYPQPLDIVTADVGGTVNDWSRH